MLSETCVPCAICPNAKETRKIGWLARLVRFLLRSTAAIACIMVMLWLAKCPGGLEWWRSVGIGFMIPVISRFL